MFMNMYLLLYNMYTYTKNETPFDNVSMDQVLVFGLYTYF